MGEALVSDPCDDDFTLYVQREKRRKDDTVTGDDIVGIYDVPMPIWRVQYHYPAAFKSEVETQGLKEGQTVDHATGRHVRRQAWSRAVARAVDDLKTTA